MILSTLVTSQLHFEMCAGLYGHPVSCLHSAQQTKPFPSLKRFVNNYKKLHNDS